MLFHLERPHKTMFFKKNKHSSHVSEGNLEGATSFMETVVETAHNAACAETIEEVEDLCVSGTVNSIANAAMASENVSKAMLLLAYMDIHSLERNFNTYLKISKLSDTRDESERRESLKDRYMECLRQTGMELSKSEDDRKIEMASWIFDTIKLNQVDDKTTPPDIKRGWPHALMNLKLMVKKQNRVFDAMISNVRSVSDVSIWYSRYCLGPALDIAKEGYIDSLLEVTALDDEDIEQECKGLADELGFDASKTSFDTRQIRCSMRQLCRSRTGYSNPEAYIVSILPRKDVQKIFELPQSV